MKDSFILYLQHKEIFDNLTDEEAGILIKAIFEYEMVGKVPKLDKMLGLVFIPIKQTLDRNREKYEKTVQRNKQNGAKGGRPKNPDNPVGILGNSENQTKPKKADNEYDNDNDNVNDNIINNVIDNIVSEETSTANTAKASKHKHGEYKHVLLKDEELQKLKEEYKNWKELIKYLDEYIEMKGYKAKSHYLCIKKWVVDAVKRNTKQSKDIPDWVGEM